MAEKQKNSRDQLNAAMMEARKRYSHRKNVTGFDVGYKWLGEEPTKELCVRIHVEEKIPVSELEQAEVFPDNIDGVPLDIIRGPYKAKLEAQTKSPRDRFATLVAGISCGRTDGSTGTLGALVIDQKTDRPALLSNWHVLAGPRGRPGDRIVQPGLADSRPDPRDEIGALNRSILDIDGDAALADLSSVRPWLPIQYGSFAVLSKIRNSRLGEVLEKSGRSTGVTQGRVDGEGIYRIRYEVRPREHEIREIAGFKLVAVTPGNPNNDELSSSGDSGSTWYNPNSGEAVGLHFAGETNPNPSAEHAIACNMSRVSERLEFRLAGFEDLLNAMNTRDVSPDSDLPVLARGLSTLEHTPNPDDPRGPGRPWGGPYPWPWPLPWPWGPGGPWGPRIDPRDLLSGGETPWPILNDRDIGVTDSRNFRHLGRLPVRRRQLRHRVESRPGTDLLEDIFPRLQQALSELDSDLANVGFNELITERIRGGDELGEIARAINLSDAFEDYPLRRVGRKDFSGATTYGHVCEDIARILDSEESTAQPKTSAVERIVGRRLGTDLLDDMFPRLQRALSEFDPGLANIAFNELITDRFRGGGALGEVALAINESNAFVDYQLRRVSRSDFRVSRRREATTYGHICEDIARILNNSRRT